MPRLLRAAAVVAALAFVGCGTGDDAAAVEPGMGEGTGAEDPATGDGAAGQEPGIGEPAELNVAAADRIEIREGGDAWPTSRRPESWDEADVLAELTDPAQVDLLVAALQDAHYIDVGAHDYDLNPPTNQVGFFEGDELVERLGYYGGISAWGEHGIEGRWLTEDWDLLAVTEPRPALE